MQILRGYADGVWAGTPEGVTVSLSEDFTPTRKESTGVVVDGRYEIASLPPHSLRFSYAAVAVQQFQHRRPPKLPCTVSLSPHSELRHRWGEQLRRSGSRWNARGGAHFCR